MNHLKKYSLNQQDLETAFGLESLPPPDSDLGQVVVIPCHNEPDILSTLNALLMTEAPQNPVEVYVVINASASASDEIQNQNRTTLKHILQWQEHQTPHFHLYPLYVPSLPPKHAGVGLARKLGMDLAYERLMACQNPQGLIVNLDADCTVSSNYFTALESHFQKNPKSPGCSIYFEHPLQGNLSREVYQAITEYELFLRYYVWGLRWAGLPCAFQTIGSAMAVRADIYKKQGGMNRRKAGEDFYFLHKIIERGDFTELNQSCVFPSPRCSDRVPFGTGKAVQDRLNETGDYLSYDLASFREIKTMVALLPQFYPLETAAQRRAYLDHLPPVLKAYLLSQDIDRKLQEIWRNTTSCESYLKRFFHWFNGFRAMKCLHAMRDEHYELTPLLPQAQRLYELCTQEKAPQDSVGLLKQYRKKDRLSFFCGNGSGETASGSHKDAGRTANGNAFPA